MVEAINSKKVVISQSMYFPWVGLLEQFKIADVFIHYDDVQLSRGFYNRVQIKTAHGIKWLTVPLKNKHRGQTIQETMIENDSNWKYKHRAFLNDAYARAPYKNEMLEVVDQVLCKEFLTLADLARESTLALAKYFDLTDQTTLMRSDDLALEFSSSQRLKELCKLIDAKTYITGHGARNYLDHELFERSKIRVEYMDYLGLEYPQLHGKFTPYVSGLDLVANCGKNGAKQICSKSVYWKIFN